MDDIQFLLTETLSHFDKNFSELDSENTNHDDFTFDWQNGGAEEKEDALPESAGLFYHIQKSTSLFVIRTFVSENIRKDYADILKNPENYPSLRLMENEATETSEKLRFFVVENTCHAEIIHEYVKNRRFPRFEENICNISDPGFSWWMVKKTNRFQIALTLSLSASDNMIKLGPLGNHQIALRRMGDFESLLNDVGLPLNFQMETNRFAVDGDSDDVLMDDLRDLFEYGVVGADLANLFRMLAHKLSKDPRVETTWIYFEELAAMRRFWIQAFYDLG